VSVFNKTDIFEFVVIFRRLIETLWNKMIDSICLSAPRLKQFLIKFCISYNYSTTLWLKLACVFVNYWASPSKVYLFQHDLQNMD